MATGYQSCRTGRRYLLGCAQGFGEREGTKKNWAYLIALQGALEHEGGAFRPRTAPRGRAVGRDNGRYVTAAQSIHPIEVKRYQAPHSELQITASSLVQPLSSLSSLTPRTPENHVRSYICQILPDNAGLASAQAVGRPCRGPKELPGTATCRSLQLQAPCHITMKPLPKADTGRPPSTSCPGCPSPCPRRSRSRRARSAA